LAHAAFGKVKFGRRFVSAALSLPRTRLARARIGTMRARSRWPHRRSAKPLDEFPPSHWITSSAVANSVSGMVRPSALAVFRLMTVSNLVGACTGNSAALSPLRIRST
jgi:hypothetical protein